MTRPQGHYHAGWVPMGYALAMLIYHVHPLTAGTATSPIKVALTIEADAELVITNGPHTTDAITRDRYFRLYHFPGMYAGDVAAQMRALRVAPGRGTGPYFGDDGGDKKRFGHGSTKEASIEEFVRMAGRAAVEHPGSSYAAAGGSFPDFRPTGTSESGTATAVEPTMKVAHNRAVRQEDWAAAGDLLSSWLKSMREAGVRLPSFFSPVNEPDASWKGGATSALQHAEFVRNVALRLRECSPDVRISGPCTAWPYPGESWKRWSPDGWERAFIEKTGDVIGAYDFHLYTKELWAYGPESPGFKADRKLPTPNLFASLDLGHPEIMDFGKADVLLDLVQAIHRAKWNTASPPVIISEFGRQGITPQLGPWANDYLYYLYATTMTRLWMSLMNRPEVCLTVPFILPESDEGYGPLRGQALATRPGAPENMQKRATPLTDFIAFFRDFEGRRIPSSWTNADPAIARGLFAVATRNEKETQLLLHNATPDPFDVSLLMRGMAAWPSEARVARMRWEGSIPADHREQTPQGSFWRRDLAAIEQLPQPTIRLEGEETVLVRIPLRTTTVKQIVTRQYLAPEYLQSINGEATANFSIELTPQDLQSARSAILVLGFSSPLGVEGGRVRVEWQGSPSPIIAALDLGEGWRHVVVPISIPIPLTELKPGTWTTRVNTIAGETPTNARIVSARLDLQSELPILSITRKP